MVEVARWTVHEIAVESARTYADPYWDVDVEVRLIAPDSSARTVEAFWDGGRTWRARFSPDQVGEWRWTFQCSDTADPGLNGQEGSLCCVPYAGDNPLYQRGPTQLSQDRRRLVHADGTPFFWLGDTAWNGVLRAQAGDWDRYLGARRQQGFTAIQFVSTQWRGCSQDPAGETAFTGTQRIRLHPEFFHRLDAKVAAINAHGLVAAPVLLWALQESDPGQALSEKDAIRLARYLVARWGAHQVIWFLGGDGHYEGERSERWKRIGRAVFGERHDRLVTMHPCGQTWVGEEFRMEPWFDLIGYQSGHGSSTEHLRWLVEGPPAREWSREPALPVLNLEPNYETHPSYHIAHEFTDREVRRASYWSLLVSPAAGVTFGHNAIWVWAESPEVPEGHGRIGLVGPWHQGVHTPGAGSMAVLRRFFDALPWWSLYPAPDMVIEQPGGADPRCFVAAAVTADLTCAVVYLPQGGEVRLDLGALEPSLPVRWFDPREGTWIDTGRAEAKAISLTAPGDDDWVLCVGRFDRGGRVVEHTGERPKA
ncbi:MAG: DUF4038 domain-containing protein [Anaerolineae bacterium]|nr:DUF4038 domain-containing protein [Anaerolineae bacterium]